MKPLLVILAFWVGVQAAAHAEEPNGPLSPEQAVEKLNVDADSDDAIDIELDNDPARDPANRVDLDAKPEPRPRAEDTDKIMREADEALEKTQGPLPKHADPAAQKSKAPTAKKLEKKLEKKAPPAP